MNYPDFLIIGAAKSGTTTLYKYLLEHPQVYMSTPKEPDFFSVDRNYSKGMAWYSSLFEAAQPGQICGEASTTYSRLQQYPHTVERMHQALPQVKLIYIMRHPVERAYSFYVHRYKGWRYNPELAASRGELVEDTFEKTIAQQPEFIDSGYYLYQIEQYLKCYPRESFLFFLMEDLIQNPFETTQKIFDFIGVDPAQSLNQDREIVANKAGDHPEHVLKRELTKPLKSIPGVSVISKMVPQGVKDAAYQTLKQLKYTDWKTDNAQYYQPPSMLDETRHILLEKYHESNQKLAEFLQRDLSHWSQ